MTTAEQTSRATKAINKMDELGRKELDAGSASDPVILAVDTSTAQPGMALTRGVEPLALLISSRVEPHSRTLFDLLSSLLDQARLTIEQVDLLAVVAGPGSFTGLRVGMAALKGIAATRGKPLYGLNLLDLKAIGLGVAAPVLVICEAGRGEVFAGYRRVTAEGLLDAAAPPDTYGDPAVVLPRLLRAAGVVDPEGIPSGSLLITGNGVARAGEVLAALAASPPATLVNRPVVDPCDSGWQILPDPAPVPLILAWHVSRLTHRQRVGEDPGTPLCHPVYIRPSDAELNWK